jgi:hypothetical protein
MKDRKYRSLAWSTFLAWSVATAACSFGRLGPSPSTKVSKPPRDLSHVTVAERQAILARAQAWQPINTAALDLLAGPQGKGAVEYDDTVKCSFVYPDSPLGGLSPKFICALGPDDTVKVKYGRTNGEVYAVVAASRLLWALGFATDRWYPVKVECRDCPEDPWPVSRVEWFKGRPRFVARRTFDMAAIERGVEGKTVETPGFRGWSWLELDRVDERSGGAPRAHLDALKLAAVFLQHNDSKPEQQDLVCPPGNIRRDEEGNERCGSARLVMSDVGATFGRGSFWKVSKMDLEKWQNAPIWLDRTGCVGNVERFLNGNLHEPKISEAGRKFLADRLALLSDRQIRDLFTAARVDRAGATIHNRSGSTRPVTVNDWVQAFKQKRDEIVNNRCAA